MTKASAGYPAFTEVDDYDAGFPDEVAGYVEAGAHIDPASDIVDTPTGPDVFFHGDHLTHPVEHLREEVGPDAVNARIGKVVHDSRNADDRKPVRDTPDDWRTGNVVLTSTSAVRLVPANAKRCSLTITNQSATHVIYVGRDAGSQAAAPDVCYLPAGAARTLAHPKEVWVIGVAGDIVDFVEESYA